MWEPNLGAGPQGQLLLNNDIKASAFQPCVTLSTRETGKAIYLGGRKGRRENVFSGPSSQLRFGSSEVRPPSLLPGPQFPGQGRVPPTPSGLANTFPGQRSTARGEGGFRSVSAPQRGAMLGSPSRGHLAPPMGVPCWGHLAEGAWHLPWAPSEKWQAQPWLAKNRSGEHS